MLPGRSFAGKTTLVPALLRRGCNYFSDEYAVIDAEGLVHPYPRRLSVRGTPDRWNVPPEEFGAKAATDPMPCVLVAGLQYDSDTGWQVETPPRARAAMTLIDNAIAARTQPGRVLAAAGHLARTACVVQGLRSDADDAAEKLLALLG